ncbi:hypothetical protein RBG61_09650 [Paludicola sp. MB14-C6]|uniref:hypothetical protein n=1 Tax=Paludihabitans sp. MB14-C6 TaxID=3070656 RepID=UPI0027DC7286|nr:hypothetical protein [Paludicola sp. MB14-C6]WMJ22252.1 hypothetical protein RBG61_09650 [Paludicola sp. MB14-C6]
MKKGKSVQSDKIALQLWMKITLLVILFFVVIDLYFLILVNITNQTANNNTTLPKVPFASSKSFCPLSENVHSVDYKKGGMLIISKSNNYIVGDKILIQNRYADKKVYSINNYYVLGVITDVNENEYMASLYSYEKESVKIQDSEIEGKVDQYISTWGAVYNNFIGIKGYILFGAIPIMGVCLLYFIFRLICIDKKQQLLNNEEAIEIQSIPVSDYIEEETEIEWVQPSKQRINEDEEQDMKPMILESQIEVTTAQTEASKTKVDVNEENQSILESEKEEHELDENMEQLETNIIEEIEQPILDKKDKRFLSADEIVAMYREKAKTKQEPSSGEYEKIAKMYYDSDINNYE